MTTTLIRALRAAALILLVAVTPLAVALAPKPVPDIDFARAGIVNALARSPDGGTVVGGWFSRMAGNPRFGIARLRADGTPDPNWAPSLPDYVVTAVAVDAAGNSYLAGDFGVVRILANGEFDAAWITDFDAAIEQIALDGNGHLYVAGYGLTHAGGRPAAGIARLTAATGIADATWTLSAPVDRRVYALAADANSLYVGGDFDTIGGQARRNLAKLTATGGVDPTWAPSPDGLVHTLAVDGTALYVGGSFETIGGQSFDALARVERGGSGDADATWHPVMQGSVWRLAVDGLGSVYAIGGFYVPPGTFRQSGRFAVAGAAVDPAWELVADGAMQAIVADAHGVVLGGQFDRVAQASRFGVAAFAAGGQLLPAANVETQADIWALARQADGGTIVGGDFHRAGAFERRHIARITAAGDVDPAWDPSIDQNVMALAIDGTGAIYAGGAFLNVSDQPRNYLARISAAGTLDPDWNPSPNFIVRAIARDSDDNLYVGGAFGSIAGWTRNRLAKIRPNGTVDPAWNPGADAEVGALALDGNGTLYVGGSFTHAGGLARAGLAKVATGGTGAVDATWNVAVNGSVSALALDRNGALYAGGWFTTVAGTPRDSLARIGANGALDLSWNPLSGGFSRSLVRGIALDPGGRIYVGGAMYPGPGLFGWLTRFTVDGAYDSAWLPFGNQTVNALVDSGDGTMLVGGTFTSIGGEERHGVAAFANDDIYANGFETP